jgi:type I restriction enzyme M protein
MFAENHQKLADKIWAVANKLRGPYRPPQYRKVMLPLIVLRRLDCVLEPTKDHVLKQLQALKARKLSPEAIEKALSRVASKDRKQPLFNTSPYTFSKLLGEPSAIAKNLTAYIKGFSPKVREIFDRFEFEAEIEKLDENNMLFEIIKEFSTVDLHPDKVPNLEMGYLFEYLIRKFNEQANEEAGDHFTPREVIRLMAHILYTGDEDIHIPGISRTVYDPTCGTGGMLSVSEEYIREQNPQAHLTLFGQDYNAEAYAICCSDMLIKDEPVDNIIYGDTLGDGKTSDGHAGKTFHYMLANPPFGVEWKRQEAQVEKEYRQFGFDGRFGPGLPRINDGALLFLLTMLSKRKPSPEEKGEGSKIAIVFNGSPLFTGDAGSGESNIRRWIIENDWLDAIIALPDQLFYNTGIFTYIWVVSNRKAKHRRGKVQLIDATQHFVKMKKSLGNKRNELSPAQIDEITKLYAAFKNDAKCKVTIDGQETERICSKVFDNREFGFIKLTVERPLRLNFQASPERIARLRNESAFAGLAESKKRKDKKQITKEVEAGLLLQQRIVKALGTLDPDMLYRSREKFKADLNRGLKTADLDLPNPVHRAIVTALSERDPDADICTDSKGNPEPDPDLRDIETVELAKGTLLPLPIGYKGASGKEPENEELVALIRNTCDEHLAREVTPHWPDAWMDYSKTKIGYEIPINRHFYVYRAPRPLETIETDIKLLEGQILAKLKEVA